MIHLARALCIRSQPLPPVRIEPTLGAQPGPNRFKPVRARPLTPWGPQVAPTGTQGTDATPPRSSAAASGGQADGTPHRGPQTADRAVRITTDPADARRTVIAGRFAQVCAALDRLVLEQEALA